MKGTFVIDAGLHMPDETISNAAPGSGVTRKNLHLESANGSTTADVWLVDDESVGNRDPGMVGKRAELEVKTHNGATKVSLVR